MISSTDDCPSKTKNPRRAAAGRRNRLLRGPVTAEQRQRCREAALERQPWLHSTGPQTAAGKAKAAANNQRRHCCLPEARLLREDSAAVLEMIKAMRATRLGT